ncbi:MAG: 4-hydroxy-tetrahydrodipicolinate reductase [Woeseiaceae bacterium]|nr:4-hydroxy-tetrahydrodipicolinate reductase [Woeseiaceae bacterium]
MIRVAIAGAGRMGQSIASVLDKDSQFESVGIWGRGDDLDALVANADVLIDFSLPEANDEVIGTVLRHRKPLVCGVSGLSGAQMAKIEEAAASIPLVFDRNMSLGIAVLERAVRDAAASLGGDFEVRINEVHHVHKKDAPSGTALNLGEAVAEARGEEGTGSVDFASERRGEVPGDHEVIMASAVERLTFAHSVTTREVFADGAVRAAAWVVSQPPGFYRMRDLLF